MKKVTRDRYGVELFVGDDVVCNDGGFLAKGTITHIGGKSGRILIGNREMKCRDLSGTVRIPTVAIDSKFLTVLGWTVADKEGAAVTHYLVRDQARGITVRHAVEV